MTVGGTIRRMDRSAPWYPHDADALRRMIAGFAPPQPPVPALGVIVPHAGYRYSGECAHLAIGAVDVPETVLVLGVDHRAGGAPFSLWPGGPWQTPFGEVPPAEELVAALAAIDGIDPEIGRHPVEHSADNEMPLLHARQPAPRAAVLNIGISPRDPRAGLARFDAVGKAVATVIKQLGEPVLIVASTDLSHEGGPGNHARQTAQDAAIRAAIEAFDAPALHALIAEDGVTMCGGGPVLVAMAATRALGAARIEVLDQRNSADATGEVGDYVVGYLAARIVG
jgi:AmmeMemoRadiSam system protein B